MTPTETTARTRRHGPTSHGPLQRPSRTVPFPTAPGPTLGVVIRHRQDLYLLVRSTFPQGFGPLTAPDTPGADATEAAAAVVAEQTLISVEDYTEVPTTDPNRRLVLATTSAPIEPPGHRRLQSAWYDLAHVRELADRTQDLANGWSTAADFAACPGLLPEWMRPLSDANLIIATDADLDLVSDLTATPAPPRAA